MLFLFPGITLAFSQCRGPRFPGPEEMYQNILDFRVKNEDLIPVENITGKVFMIRVCRVMMDREIQLNCMA